MVRRTSLTSLADRTPRVSAYLLLGQTAILILIAVVTLVGRIWWAFALAVLLIVVGLFVGIVNAKRDDWFV